MTKNNYGIKHGRQGRPRVITKVHDVDKTRSCPIEATSRKCHVQKNTKKCRAEVARTIQWVLKHLDFSTKTTRQNY